MFETVLVESRNKKQKRISFLAGSLIVISLFTIGVLVPVAFPDKLAAANLAGRIFLPPPPPAAGPGKIDTIPLPKRGPDRKSPEKPPEVFRSPPEIPKNIPVPDVTEPPQNNRGVPGGTTGGIPNGTGNFPLPFPFEPPRVEQPAPLPVPPPPPPATPAQRVRVGGNVIAANLVSQVRPVYPQLAKQARVQGVVVLEAEISKEGTIENLRVLNGHPLLTQAAIDAVKQWRYKPTMLNGQPVTVVTTITVTFQMQ